MTILQAYWLAWLFLGVLIIWDAASAIIVSLLAILSAPAWVPLGLLIQGFCWIRKRTDIHPAATMPTIQVRRF